jgi:hypothetical protein
LFQWTGGYEFGYLLLVRAYGSRRGARILTKKTKFRFFIEVE